MNFENLSQELVRQNQMRKKTLYDLARLLQLAIPEKYASSMVLTFNKDSMEYLPFSKT